MMQVLHHCGAGRLLSSITTLPGAGAGAQRSGNTTGSSALANLSSLSGGQSPGLVVVVGMGL
jgi:hypothetical protein